MQKAPTFTLKYIKDGKLSSPAMESTTKSNVLKVFRIAVFSNINYDSIEHLRIVYKTKIFIKTFQQFFIISTSFQHSDREHIKI